MLAFQCQSTQSITHGQVKAARSCFGSVVFALWFEVIGIEGCGTFDYFVPSWRSDIVSCDSDCAATTWQTGGSWFSKRDAPKRNCRVRMGGCCEEGPDVVSRCCNKVGCKYYTKYRPPPLRWVERSCVESGGRPDGPQRRHLLGSLRFGKKSCAGGVACECLMAVLTPQSIRETSAVFLVAVKQVPQ